MSPFVATERYAAAVAYAAELHKNQTRKGTDIPYLCHLLAVSASVIEAGADEEVAIAALLHDTAEDQGGRPRLDDIEARFGPRVARIVEGCSDFLDESGPKPPSKQRRQLHLSELEHRADPDVLLVTAADKLHNARAIATDLANQGPAMLRRFSGDADELLWYYDTELELLQRKGVPAVLTTPLVDAVALIKERIAS